MKITFSEMNRIRNLQNFIRIKSNHIKFIRVFTEKLTLALLF